MGHLTRHHPSRGRSCRRCCQRLVISCFKFDVYNVVRCRCFKSKVSTVGDAVKFFLLRLQVQGPHCWDRCQDHLDVSSSRSTQPCASQFSSSCVKTGFKPDCSSSKPHRGELSQVQGSSYCKLSKVYPSVWRVKAVSRHRGGEGDT